MTGQLGALNKKQDKQLPIITIKPREPKNKIKKKIPLKGFIETLESKTTS